MKTILLLILFFSFNFYSISQNRRETSHFYGLEFQYSYFQTNIKALNSFLNTNYGHSITDVRLVGLNFKALTEVNRKHKYDSNFSFDYVLPTTYMSTSATRSFDIKGYQWGMMILGNDLLYKKKNVDLIFGTGLNAGKFKLHEDNETTTVDFFNKFLAPKLTSEFRLIFGKMCVGIRAEYQYDISNKSWKSTTNEFLPLTKFTGYKIQAFVGLGKVNR